MGAPCCCLSFRMPNPLHGTTWLSNNWEKSETRFIQRYRISLGQYPAAFAIDQNGNPSCSWRVVIAAYLSTANLSRTPVLTQPWNFEFSARLGQQIPDVSISPLVTYPPTSTETQVFSVRHPNSIMRAGALEGAADLDNGCQVGDVPLIYLITPRTGPRR